MADSGNNRILKFSAPFSSGQDAGAVLGEPDLTTSLGIFAHCKAVFMIPNSFFLTRPERFGSLTLEIGGYFRLIRLFQMVRMQVWSSDSLILGFTSRVPASVLRPNLQ